MKKMTQAQIKENLPPLPLFSVNDFNQIQDDKSTLCFVIQDRNEIKKEEKNTAFKEAIVHSINNTYGKGINPLRVSDVFNALQSAIKVFESRGDDGMAIELKGVIKKATL